VSATATVTVTGIATEIAAVPVLADQVSADQVSADQVSADQVSADQADLVLADREVQGLADQAVPADSGAVSIPPK